jgi:protein TonB
MSAPALRREESLGLAIALAGHAALFAWMVWQEPAPPPPLPERMTVTISDEVGLTSAAPAPRVEAAPDKGPEIGEAPPPPAPEPVQVAKPAPVPPRPVPAPAKVAAKPSTQPVKPAARQTSQTQPKSPPKSAGKPGNSVFDDAFNNGIPKGKGSAATAPAAATGQQKSAINQAIWREIRPFWQGKVPQGLNTDKIVSYVKFQLNPDGSLVGPPVLVRQEGVDASNKQQARRHAEEAIKAISRAAPFDLPAQFYAYWKSPPEIKFSKSNSQ